MEAFVRLCEINQHLERYTKKQCSLETFRIYASDFTILEKPNANAIIYLSVGKTLIVACTCNNVPFNEVIRYASSLSDHVEGQLVRHVNINKRVSVDLAAYIASGLTNDTQQSQYTNYSNMSVFNASTSPLQRKVSTKTLTSNNINIHRISSVLSMMKVKVSSSKVLKVQKFVRSFLDATTVPCVVFTGHGFGGNCVQYLAHSMSLLYGSQITVKVVAFGAANMFDQTFVKSYNKLLKRSYNFIFPNDRNCFYAGKFVKEVCKFPKESNYCSCFQTSRSYNNEAYINAMYELNAKSQNILSYFGSASYNDNDDEIPQSP